MPYYILYDHKPVEIVENGPLARNLPADTYVYAVYPDNSTNLMRAEFHQGRGGRSPWAMGDFRDPELPPHVRAYLLLMGEL